jgi:FkbH-like protein/FkbM family methyltransferase
MPRDCSNAPTRLSLPIALEPLAQREFKVSTISHSYLSDHRVADMVVVPGSHYLELALHVHSDLLKRSAASLKAIFRTPVMLSENDTSIRLSVADRGDGRFEYRFAEASDDDVSPEPPKQDCAVVEIHCLAGVSSGSRVDEFTIKQFLDEAPDAIHGTDFYGALRNNGNQYGARFQHWESVWRHGSRVLGKLPAPIAGDADRLLGIVADCTIQLLAAFRTGAGTPFVLRSIDRLELHSREFPQTIWALGTRVSDAQDTQSDLIGNVEVFDETGRTYLRLYGVNLAYLDFLPAESSTTAAPISFCIASTFTAEPLEDSLKFWAEHWGLPIRTGFAPFNQVFQELLGPGGALGRNRDGINVVLLSLEDWIQRKRFSLHDKSKDYPEGSFGKDDRLVLPNGLKVAHLNEYETRYVYSEIFEDRCYLRHGIQLNGLDAVIDIGANIGLFSLFVLDSCPDAKIYAYEPGPVFELLKANCEAYGPHIHAFHCGVSDREKVGRFTFYEKSSLFSGFHSDEREDRQAIEAIVRNVLRQQTSPREDWDDDVRALTAQRLQATTYECPLTSVSDIIRANRIDRVGLLKVDAEKSELEILRGIEEEHWPRIDQIVMEVHDRTGQTIREIEAILGQNGFRYVVDEERLLHGSGLFNIYASRHPEFPSENPHPLAETAAALRRDVEDFCAVLKSFMDLSPVPLLLVPCPVNFSAGNARLKEALDGAEQELLERAGTIPNVHVLGSQQIVQQYPAQNYFDPHARQLGHIPYTAAGYASIGTAVFRKVLSLRKPPHKVIVTDCDNTLWQGTCGEDGPQGVSVTPGHRALQQFLVRQVSEGMMLCLASKNNESDVWAVFDQRGEMLLKREHLAAWRIHWEHKSASLHALASELNVGLESLIFLDDNPVECAEVAANCPEVVVLQLPSRSEDFVRYLDNVWAFDRGPVTAEDRRRTQMAKEGAEREQYRAQAPTLKQFIAGLELRLDFSEPQPEDFNRISQLTLRTNQFNFTAVRRSEQEIAAFLGKEGGRGLLARVTDRFGDYGLVGVVLYESDIECCRADTFLLSCRALGRGVEHRILAEIGRRAAVEGKQWVEIPFCQTARNEPAWNFISPLGAERLSHGGTGAIFRFASEKLAQLRYEPGEYSESREAGSLPEPAANSGPRGFRQGLSQRVRLIAEEFADVKRISAAIEGRRLRDGGFGSTVSRVEDLPATLENRLLRIWQKTLGNPGISINDNFFDAGGTSLKAVLAMAAIRNELNLNLSVIHLFECPTVRLLCERLGNQGLSGETSTAAMARGSRRRQLARKRD